MKRTQNVQIVVGNFNLPFLEVNKIRNKLEIVDGYIKQIEQISNNNLRLFSIISNLYNEFVINLILSEKFIRPEKIIGARGSIRSFNNKLILLDALGILECKNILYKNLETLNTIRNTHAHKITTEEIPEGVKKRIDSLWNCFKNNYQKQKKLTYYEKYKIIESEVLTEIFIQYLKNRKNGRL